MAGRRSPHEIDRSLILPDTPLLLSIAAELAYPDRSMSVSGLRKERDRGRLQVERTAGREYTTLAAIGAMRRLCIVTPKGSEHDRSTRSSMLEDPTRIAASQAAAEETVAKLRAMGRKRR